MKVVILEDEEIIRQGIMNKIQKMQLPVEIVGEGGNGIEGLELIQSRPTDIVITDIRMPGADGLAFIEQARQLHPTLQYIVISGYNDFKYAQQALKFQVSDYLLKPVDDDELKEALSTVIERIEEERMNTAELSRLWNEQELNRETIRQHMLTRFVQQGQRNDWSMAARDEQLFELKERMSQYAAAVFILESFKLPMLSFQVEDEQLLWFAIKNVIVDRLRSNGYEGILFNHALNEYELVYVIGIPNVQQRDGIQTVLKQTIVDLKSCLKLNVTIGLGAIVDRMEQVQQSYQQAKFATRNELIHGSGQIYGDLFNRSTDRRSALSEGDERLLTHWLREGQIDAMNTWVNKQMNVIVHDREASYSHLEWFCIDLFLFYRKFLLSETSISEWVIGEMDDLLQSLKHAHSWEDAAVQMTRYTMNIQGYLSKKEPVVDVMEEMKRYIDNSFHEPISLQTISEKFYIHPNYFSRRFKERFGESFIDYLTLIRMNKAKQLMKDTSMKIFEIAQMVGFEDAAYFSSVFRRLYGVTPKQFREN